MKNFKIYVSVPIRGLFNLTVYIRNSQFNF